MPVILNLIGGTQANVAPQGIVPKYRQGVISSRFGQAAWEQGVLGMVHDVRQWGCKLVQGHWYAGHVTGYAGCAGQQGARGAGCRVQVAAGAVAAGYVESVEGAGG